MPPGKNALSTLTNLCVEHKQSAPETAISSAICQKFLRDLLRSLFVVLPLVIGKMLSCFLTVACLHDAAVST